MESYNVYVALLINMHVCRSHFIDWLYSQGPDMSRWAIWIMSFGRKDVVVSIVPVDGLAPFGAGTSAGIVMIKFDLNIWDPHLKDWHDTNH